MNNTDTIKISGLKVEAIIGVFEWERTITQPLLIDVAIHTNTEKAAQSDDIEDAINYKSVCDDITKWCIDAEAKLIERLADIIASRLLTHYDTSLVEVTVAKPTAIREADCVSVSITRQKT